MWKKRRPIRSPSSTGLGRAMFPCTEAPVDRLSGRIEMQAISMTKVVSGVRGFRPQRAPSGLDRGPAALIRLARQRPSELTLVALGPLTNLAIALNVEPRLPELLKSLVIMGGAYTVPGNTTPAAEFNILVDPEAADQVFTAPFPRMTAVGLDVTEQVALTRDDWDAVNTGTSLPRTATLLREVGGSAFSKLGRDQFALHDPLSVAIAIDPTLIEIRELAIAVDTVDPELGRTRIMGPGTVRVAASVESVRALEDFRRTVGLPLA